MIKKIMKLALLGVFLFSLGAITSCKNYDDDIDGLGGRLSAVESDILKLKKSIENALNSGHTVIDYKLDNGVYTVTLSNGEKLPLVSSDEGTPFYQFMVEDGFWKYSKDKGDKWEKVKSATNTDMPAGEKDNIFFDKTDGYIYIAGVKTNITADKKHPILALNKENKTLYVYIGGEGYIMPVQGSGFSGISSIIYQKQYVSEADEYLEAVTIENATGTILASVPAVAYFKIVPKDIDLTSATLECTDIHALKTRAEEPTLSVESDMTLNDKGILEVSLTPSSLADGLYYGATLEITLDKATSSSNYFVVKPTMRKIEEAKVFSTIDKITLADNATNPIELINDDAEYDLKTLYALGYPKDQTPTSEYASMNDLGIDVTVAYSAVAALPTGVAMTNGVVKAGTTAQIGISFKVLATYSYNGSTLATRELSVLIVDASAASSVALSTVEDLSAIESLFVTDKDLALTYPIGIGSKLTNGTYYLGQQSGGSYAKIAGVSLEVLDDVLTFKVDPKTNFTETYSRLAVIDATGNLIQVGAAGDEKSFYISNVKVDYVVSVSVKKENLDSTTELKEVYNRIKCEMEGGKYLAKVDFSTLYDIKPVDLDVVFSIEKENQYTSGNDGLLYDKWNDIDWSNPIFSIKPRIDSKKVNFVNQKDGAGGLKVDVSYTGADGNPAALPTADWKFFDPVKYPYGTRGDGTFFINALTSLGEQINAVTVNMDFDAEGLSDMTIKEALAAVLGNRSLTLVDVSEGYPGITYDNGTFANDEVYKDILNASSGIRMDIQSGGGTEIEFDHAKGKFKKKDGFTSGQDYKFRVFYHYYGGGTGTFAMIWLNIVEINP